MFIYLLVFLCLFILFRLLCLEWAFCILVVCGSFLLWRFHPVGGVADWFVKVSWFGKLASVFWYVELDCFSLSAMECPVMSFGMGLCVWCDFRQLSVDAQGYVPALLENLHGVSCSGTYWLLRGGWFWCRYGGFWTVSYYLMFRVVRNFLVFSGFGLKYPASGFQFYSSNSLKTSPTMQH